MTTHAMCPTHLILLGLITIIFREEDKSCLFIMHFSRVSCYSLPLRIKYLPWHSILKPLSPCDSFNMTQLHTHIRQQEKLHICNYLSLYIYTVHGKTKDSVLNGSRHSPKFNFLFHFFLHAVLICYSHSQIFEGCHVVNGQPKFLPLVQ